MEKMQCINPADIQEGNLLAYLYGDAPPRVAAHIACCAFCAEQVEQLRMVDSQLFAAFYQETCPTPETLADYVLRRLPDPERLRIAAHIRACAQCAAEVSAVDDLDDAAPTSLLKRLRETLALALTLHPVRQSLSPVRGEGWQGRFEHGFLLITVSAQPSGLTGRVRRREPTECDYSGQAWLLAPAAASEAEIAQSPIDAQGRFYFTGTPPGEYTLLLQVGQQYLSLQTVQVL